MSAPERFADSQIPLAPRAPSIHGDGRMWVSTCVQLGTLLDFLLRLRETSVTPLLPLLPFKQNIATCEHKRPGITITEIRDVRSSEPPKQISAPQCHPDLRHSANNPPLSRSKAGHCAAKYGPLA